MEIKICGLTKIEEAAYLNENNVNYAVYLNDGAMVGIFLDQKDVRKAMKIDYFDNENGTF